MSTNPAALPPLSHASVTVGGKPYCVKYSVRAIYELSKNGINVFSFAEDYNRFTNANRGIQARMIMAGAALGSFSAEQEWIPSPLSGEDLSSRITDEAEMLSLSQAAWEVFAKKLGLTIINADPAPAPADQAKPEPTQSQEPTDGSLTGRLTGPALPASA